MGPVKQHFLASCPLDCIGIPNNVGSSVVSGPPHADRKTSLGASSRPGSSAKSSTRLRVADFAPEGTVSRSTFYKPAFNATVMRPFFGQCLATTSLGQKRVANLRFSKPAVLWLTGSGTRPILIFTDKDSDVRDTNAEPGKQETVHER